MKKQVNCYVWMTKGLCCVFWPAFESCAHLKAGWNTCWLFPTFFVDFRHFLVIFHWKIRKYLKNSFFSYPPKKEKIGTPSASWLAYLRSRLNCFFYRCFSIFWIKITKKQSKINKTFDSTSNWVRAALAESWSKYPTGLYYLLLIHYLLECSSPQT